MANNRNNKNAPANGSSVVLTVTVLVLALMVVAVGLIGYYSEGWQNWDRFIPDKGDQQPAEPGDTDGNITGGITDGDGNEMTPGEVYPMPKNMVFATTAVESDKKITLKATFNPAGVTNQAVDWKVEFVNGTSEWASGKTVTDYVTVTPTSDGALTAEVSCAEAFGAKIKITVTSREDTNVTNSCTVDFAKRVVSAEIKLTKGGAAASVLDFSTDGLDYTLSVEPTYGVGTIEDEFDMTLTYKGTQALLDAVKAAVSDSGSYTIATLTDTAIHTDMTLLNKLYGFTKYTTSAEKNKVGDAIEAYSGNVIDVTAKYVGEYSSFDVSKSFAKGTAAFDVYPESIVINPGEIIF